MPTYNGDEVSGLPSFGFSKNGCKVCYNCINWTFLVVSMENLLIYNHNYAMQLHTWSNPIFCKSEFPRGVHGKSVNT